MRQPNRENEIPTGMMNAAAANHHQLLSTLEDHIHPQMFPSSSFEPAPSQEDFLEQMLSSSAAGFPWVDDHPSPNVAGEQPAKMRQQQIAAKALMFQQQLLLSAGANGNDVVDEPHSSNSADLTNDASIKAFLNGFAGSLGQTPNQNQHFHHAQGGALQQSQNFGAAAMSQATASGSSGGGAAAGQPKQRVRARRGQATDPHSIAERLRRERIAERMKSLQELVPNANKTDKASMLDEIIDYVKFLQLQVKVLSMSRLGGAAAVVADKSPEGKRVSGASSSNNNSNTNDGMTVAERQVAKLMEDDMGSAMQYLQGKGLCLMPISLATAISTVTSHSRNTSATTSNNPLFHGDAGAPTSPSISVLTGQSATVGGEVSFKDAPKLE